MPLFSRTGIAAILATTIALPGHSSSSSRPAFSARFYTTIDTTGKQPANCLELRDPRLVRSETYLICDGRGGPLDGTADYARVDLPSDGMVYPRQSVSGETEVGQVPVTGTGLNAATYFTRTRDELIRNALSGLTGAASNHTGAVIQSPDNASVAIRLLGTDRVVYTAVIDAETRGPLQFAVSLPNGQGSLDVTLDQLAPGVGTGIAEAIRKALLAPQPLPTPRPFEIDLGGKD